MQGPNHSHLEQGAARPLPLSSAACREASLRRSWPQQRVVQVIVAPKLGSGESMPDKAGVGAMLGKAHLGDQSHTPIRQYQIWAFAADLKHYKADYALIALYLEDLRELNPGTHTALKADAEGQFEALFYSLGVVGDVANNCLMRCVQLDGAHMKHKEYNGVAFVLEGSDANDKNVMLALGLVPKENERWYHWFLSHVSKSAIGKFLTEYQAAEWQGFSAFRPYAASIISDRHKGLPGPLQELFSEVYSVACTRHITTNMYAAKMGFNQAQAGLVWAAQGAESAAAYLSIMGQLITLNPKAYDYLQRLGPENWALYSTSAQRVPMYSTNTSNRVEANPGPIPISNCNPGCNPDLCPSPPTLRSCLHRGVSHRMISWTKQSPCRCQRYL